MLKHYTIRHVFITIGIIAALTVVLYTAIILRDYSISFDGGPHLEAKIAVPGPPSISLDSTVPNKLRVNLNSSSAEAYDVQISRFKNFAVSRTYRTVLPYKEVGLMKGGKTYYVRARCVVKKPGTVRKVHGRYGSAHSIRIRDKTKADEEKEKNKTKRKNGFRLPF